MSQNNGTGHKSDYELLAAIEQRIHTGEPAGDPVLDELAGLRPFARKDHVDALEDALVQQAQHQKRLTERNQPMQATYPNAIPGAQPNKRKTIPIRKRIPATLVAVLTTAILAVTTMFALNQSPGDDLGAGILPVQNEATSTPTWTATSTLMASPTHTSTATMASTLTPSPSATFTPTEGSAPPLVVTPTYDPWGSTSQGPISSTMVLPFANVEMSDAMIDALQIGDAIQIFAIIPVEREATTSNGDMVTVADTLTPSVTQTDDARVLRINTAPGGGIESLGIEISDTDRPILEWLVDAGVTLTIEFVEQ